MTWLAWLIWFNLTKYHDTTSDCLSIICHTDDPYYTLLVSSFRVIALLWSWFEWRIIILKIVSNVMSRISLINVTWTILTETHWTILHPFCKIVERLNYGQGSAALKVSAQSVLRNSTDLKSFRLTAISQVQSRNWLCSDFSFLYPSHLIMELGTWMILSIFIGSFQMMNHLKCPSTRWKALKVAK